MALDLSRMKAKLDSVQGRGGGNSSFWRPEDGEQTIRIVPTPDGDPFKSYFFHYNVGTAPGFLCPKRNFSDDCPVCSFVSKLFAKKDDESVSAAKDMMAKQRFSSPVLVRGEEEKGVRIWSYGKTVYETLLNLVLNPEYGDITDLDKGTDLLMHYGKPTGASFPQTKLQPRRKTSPLHEDTEALEKFVNNIPDFDGVFERKSTHAVGVLLDTYLTGGEESDTAETVVENDVDRAFDELIDS